MKKNFSLQRLYSRAIKNAIFFNNLIKNNKNEIYDRLFYSHVTRFSWGKTRTERIYFRISDKLINKVIFVPMKIRRAKRFLTAVIFSFQHRFDATVAVHLVCEYIHEQRCESNEFRIVRVASATLEHIHQPKRRTINLIQSDNNHGRDSGASAARRATARRELLSRRFEQILTIRRHLKCALERHG